MNIIKSFNAVLPHRMRNNSGLIPALLAALPAVMSLAQGFLGKKKSGGDTVPAKTFLPDFQLNAGTALGDYIQKFLGQYQPGKPYTGDFVAPMTGAENTGLDQLNQYLSQTGTGDLFSAAKQQTLDTLGGKYANPQESPFINSMINLSKLNLRDSINTSRRGAGSRGTYFTQSAIQDENRLRERSGVELDALVGEFINQERERQGQAAIFAQQLDEYANQEVPLAKINASQEYGSLPRLIQKAQLEGQYEDFKRKQMELSYLPGGAQNLLNTGTSASAYVPSYTNPVIQENSSLGNILGIIQKLNLKSLSGGGTIWDKIGGLVGK